MEKPINVILAHRKDENTWYDSVGEADDLDSALELISKKAKAEKRPIDKIVIELRSGSRLKRGKLEQE